MALHGLPAERNWIPLLWCCADFYNASAHCCTLRRRSVAVSALPFITQESDTWHSKILAVLWVEPPKLKIALVTVERTSFLVLCFLVGFHVDEVKHAPSCWSKNKQTCPPSQKREEDHVGNQLGGQASRPPLLRFNRNHRGKCTCRFSAQDVVKCPTVGFRSGVACGLPVCLFSCFALDLFRKLPPLVAATELQPF